MRPIIPDVALGPRAEELSFCRSAQIRFDLTGVEQARRQTANGFSFDSRSVVLFSNLCLALLWGSLRVPRPEPFFFCLQSVRYGARVTPDGSRENGADFKIWEEGGRWTSAFSGEPIDDWAPALWGWASDYIGRLRIQLGEELFPLFDWPISRASFVFFVAFGGDCGSQLRASLSRYCVPMTCTRYNFAAAFG